MFPVAGLGLVFLSLWFRPDAPRSLAGVNDFMGIYAGTRLVGTPEQFDAGAYLREQVRATGWAAPSILYTRLPAFAFLLRPLGHLDYRAAYVVWLGRRRWPARLWTTTLAASAVMLLWTACACHLMAFRTTY